MNGLKNQSAPSPEPGVREAAIKLLVELDARRVSAGVVDQLEASSAGSLGDRLLFGSIEALRQALQRDRTAVLMISDPTTAAEGIKRMKAGEEISPAHVHAIVEAAEAALANESNGIMRFEADMRAIKRWQAAAPPGEDRSLIWPDHADLVVWLLELVELQPPCPTLAVVEQLTGLLDSWPNWKMADGFDPKNVAPVMKQSSEAMRQLANALIASSRRTVRAEALGAQLVEQLRRERFEPEKVGGRLDRVNGHPRGGRVYDSLRFVLGRPDVHEAIAKALCHHNGGDWAQATEGGRQAFREEADRLIAEALAAPQ